jgi:MFS family permease
MSTTHATRATQRQFLFISTAEYWFTGLFWVFATLGGMKVQKDEFYTFYLSLIVLFLSNGVWEVLTGWYADKFRRTFSIAAGFLACTLGFLLMGFSQHSNSLALWSIGLTVWSLGPALLSGAREAWLVDRIRFLNGKDPESLSSLFTLSASLGIVFKTLGALLAIVLYQQSGALESEPPSASLLKAFLSCGLAGAAVSGVAFLYSLRLKEEYWSNPKYLTEETLFVFLAASFRHILRRPFLWFVVGYSGATCLTYLVSSTLWPAVVLQPRDTLPWPQAWPKPMPWHLAVGIVFVELIAGVSSFFVAAALNRIRSSTLRAISTSAFYCTPLLPLLAFDTLLPTILVATFFFRCAYAALLGNLDTYGQSAIQSDDKRAVMVSFASALGLFLFALLAAGFLLFARHPPEDVSLREQHLLQSLSYFWFVALPVGFLMTIFGLTALMRPSRGGGAHAAP